MGGDSFLRTLPKVDTVGSIRTKTLGAYVARLRLPRLLKFLPFVTSIVEHKSFSPSSSYGRQPEGLLL